MRQRVWSWAQQPRGRAQPNLELSERLRFLWSGASHRSDLLSGELSGIGAAVVEPSEHGYAAKCSSGQQNIEWPRTFLNTSNGVGSGDFTLMVVANPESGGGAVEHLISQKNDAGGSPFAQAALIANANTGASYVAGSAAFFTFNSSSSGVAATSAVDGLWHVWMGIRRGTTHELWRDGILLASLSLTVRTITQSATRYMAVGSRGNGTTEAYRRNALYAAGWDRALTSAEAAAFKSPALCHGLLFEPRRIWVPVTAAPTGPTVTALLRQRSQFIGSGLR